MNLIDAPQYSLSWKPEGELLNQLQGVINTLGVEFGADKDGAETFVPHITVVPDIILGTHFDGGLNDFVKAVEAMVHDLPAAASLKLKEVDKGKTFFQCVFARAELTEVMEATVQKARETFRPDMVKAGAVFMPHLSLLYGEYPEEVKDQAISRARSMLTLPQTFSGQKISIWTSGIPAREWQMVEEFEVTRLIR